MRIFPRSVLDVFNFSCAYACNFLQVRGHLSSIAKRLAKAVDMMAGPGVEVARSAAEVAQKEAIIKAAKETLEGEHLKAVARKVCAACVLAHGWAVGGGQPLEGEHLKAVARKVCAACVLAHGWAVGGGQPLEGEQLRPWRAGCALHVY